MRNVTEPRSQSDQKPASPRSRNVRRRRTASNSRSPGQSKFRTNPPHGVGIPILRIVSCLNCAIAHDKEIWIPGFAFSSDSDGYLVLASKANADELAWYLRVLIAEATLTMYQVDVATDKLIINLTRID